MGAHHHRQGHRGESDTDSPVDTATLSFLGAAGTVTGSKYLITAPTSAGSRRILVDAGLFQGEKAWRLKNWDPFPVDPATISDVLLTHAHMDHSGYLPALVRQGFTGRIHCTPPTRALTEIVLRDSAFLQEKDAQFAAQRGFSKHHPPLALYGIRDVERTLPLFALVDYDTDLHLGDGITARYTRAGHILGAASVRVAVAGTAILFSGDLGRLDHPVLRPRETPAGAPYVVVESTYGDREHPEPGGLAHETLADAIRRTAQRGGSVLVPAFAVDRTEVVLKTLTELRHEGRIPEMPIYVNSPMGLAALGVYTAPENAGELRSGRRLRDMIDLHEVREARSKEESMALNNPRMPSIIISSSGMATGGRVLHHLKRMLPDDRNTIVLTGFQASGTRGRALLDGAQQLKMHGAFVPVRAEIVRDDEFSVHADASELLDWLRALSPAPRTVFVAHGEPDSAEAFAAQVRRLGPQVVVPSYGQRVELG